MENKIKVSVIIPVYNQPNLVIRALESIPARDDIEIIVIDDASTDTTFYTLEKYITNTDKNVVLLYNEENKGVGYTMNKGYDAATGEYVVPLGSDDYFITDRFIECLDELDGTDMVYFNLEINNGDIWSLGIKNKNHLCGSTKFTRREFLGDTRCPEIRVTEDKDLYVELQKKKPTEKFTNLTIKHYNWPRKGSLSWMNDNKGENDG